MIYSSKEEQKNDSMMGFVLIMSAILSGLIIPFLVWLAICHFDNKRQKKQDEETNTWRIME